MSIAKMLAERAKSVTPIIDGVTFVTPEIKATCGCTPVTPVTPQKQGEPSFASNDAYLGNLSRFWVVGEGLVTNYSEAAISVEVKALYPGQAITPIGQSKIRSISSMQSCLKCEHWFKVGLNESGYCASHHRRGEPSPYGLNHAARLLPPDGGASCNHFEDRKN
jgi:hypothetical protein